MRLASILLAAALLQPAVSQADDKPAAAQVEIPALVRHARIAFCLSAAAPGGAGGHCNIFSLAGFARAYDFVCDAQ